MSRFTFTKTGGPAQYLAFPKNLDELKILVETVKTNNLPLTVIGNASNLIIRDGGISGLVLILTKMDEIVITKKKQQLLQMLALELLIHLKQHEAGLSGLEFAAGIPGSVGGAVFMNAGAYLADRICH